MFFLCQDVSDTPAICSKACRYHMLFHARPVHQPDGDSLIKAEAFANDLD